MPSSLAYPIIALSERSRDARRQSKSRFGLTSLQKCRSAIPANGKLLLVEWIMPARDEPREGFRLWDTVTTDLIMLTVFGSRGGHVRTRPQFEALLRAADFAVAAVVPTHSSVYVIEAVPVA